ncbi:hypothetical protein BKI52_20960 [marine bacterium AO1-C]|nr:hypothetical protein BKI52_20960 [marine bacterium AO1-C]
MSNCVVEFWENQNQEDGGYRKFENKSNYSDLSSYHWTIDGEQKSGGRYEMDDSISSLKTGSQAWLLIFSRTDYEGSSYLVGPNTTLNSLKDLNGIDMNNNIESFQLFDYAPVNTNTIITNLHDLYPVDNTDDQKSEHKSRFYAQDSEYCVYDPSITQSGDVVKFEMKVDHFNTMGGNDKATITFSMDTYGTFVDQISVDYDMSSGAYNVPPWAIKIADLAVDVIADELKVLLDGAELVVSDGALFELLPETNELIDMAAKAITFCIDHLNDVINFLYGLSDDGGTTNFSAIVSHGIARLILAYNEERFGASPGFVTFSDATFVNEIGDNWHEDKHNPYLMFDNGGSSYRCYYPDNTSFYAKAGLLSSVKIDAIRDIHTDDHLVLHVVFDPNGQIFSIQGCIDIHSAPDSKDYDSSTDTYESPSSGVICYDTNGNIVQIKGGSVYTLAGYGSLTEAYADKMQYALDNVAYVNHDNYSDALKNVVPASVFVLQGIDASVS